MKKRLYKPTNKPIKESFSFFTVKNVWQLELIQDEIHNLLRLLLFNPNLKDIRDDIKSLEFKKLTLQDQLLKDLSNQLQFSLI